MTAEEYYPDWAKENPTYIHSKIVFAEDYAKHLIKSISDQDIDNKFNVGDMSSGFERYNRYKRRGAKWLKQQLLHKLYDQ